MKNHTFNSIFGGAAAIGFGSLSAYFGNVVYNFVKDDYKLIKHSLDMIENSKNPEEAGAYAVALGVCALYGVLLIKSIPCTIEGLAMLKTGERFPISRAISRKLLSGKELEEIKKEDEHLESRLNEEFTREDFYY